MIHLAHIIPSTVFCLLLIIVRCGYRLLRSCKIHSSCHRTWHDDDAYMAFASLPLLARAICVSFVTELTREGASRSDLVLAAKLLVPARLSYALFLWCLKLTLLSFYTRMATGSSYLARTSRIAFWILVLTFLAVVLATLLECRPLSLFWTFPTHHCTAALANLLSMAITNITTDILLILLPLPPLFAMTLSRTQKLQLALVFGAGLFVIMITVARIPLIINQSVSQSVRSMWASIEIATACLVANVAFFYALIKDMSRGHGNSRASLSARGRASLILSSKKDSTSSSMKTRVEYLDLVNEAENSHTRESRDGNV